MRSFTMPELFDFLQWRINTEFMAFWGICFVSKELILVIKFVIEKNRSALVVCPATVHACLMDGWDNDLNMIIVSDDSRLSF